MKPFMAADDDVFVRDYNVFVQDYNLDLQSLTVLQLVAWALWRDHQPGNHNLFHHAIRYNIEKAIDDD